MACPGRVLLRFSGVVLHYFILEGNLHCVYLQVDRRTHGAFMVVSIIFSLVDALWKGVNEVIGSLMLLGVCTLGSWAWSHGCSWEEMVFGFSDCEEFPKCTALALIFLSGCSALPTTDTSLLRPAHISQVCLGHLGGQCWSDVGAVLGGAGLAGGLWLCWDELRAFVEQEH